MGEKRRHVDDLRGASRLAVEATRGVVDLVRAMHETIGGGPAVLGRPLDGVTKLASRPIYGSIRAVTDLVGAGIDAALAQLAPLLGESAPGPEREAVLAAVNGVLGDYLAETANPLAMVPVDSALGRCARPELALDFPESHRFIALGTGHLDLLDRPEVYETVRSWLA